MAKLKTSAINEVMHRLKVVAKGDPERGYTALALAVIEQALKDMHGTIYKGKKNLAWRNARDSAHRFFASGRAGDMAEAAGIDSEYLNRLMQKLERALEMDEAA